MLLTKGLQPHRHVRGRQSRAFEVLGREEDSQPPERTGSRPFGRKHRGITAQRQHRWVWSRRGTGPWQDQE